KPPVIPSHWRSVRFRVMWHGQPVQVCVDGRSVELANMGSAEVPVLTPQGKTAIAPGDRSQWEYAR
ncbi:MAG: hypothetical protein NZ741_12415, partial [Armatimonadetes bacterium]|nr:hypothetical protein [Armatimonadota bacterium]